MEWIIGIIVLVFLAKLFKPSRCDVCGTGFKRNYYTWKIDGKKQHLCPNCNSKMKKEKVTSALKTDSAKKKPTQWWAFIILCRQPCLLAFYTHHHQGGFDMDLYYCKHPRAFSLHT